MSEAFSYDDGAEGWDDVGGQVQATRDDERAHQDGANDRENDGGREEGDIPAPRERRPDPNRAAARQRVELREARERERALQDRLERLERAQSRETAADPIKAATEADWEKDPIGAGIATQQALRAYQGEREQTTAQEQAQQKENARVATLANWADAHIEDFKAEKPDFDKAVDFIAKGLTKEQKAAGASDQEAAKAVASYVLGIIERSKERGKDPAAALYAIAGTRGYSTKLDKEDDVAQQKQGSRGESPFARTGTRSGGGGVSMREVAEAPKESTRAILKGGTSFDKKFEAMKAQSKGGSRR